jgi:hypothetical protein
MDDDVRVINEFGEQLAILDAVEVILHAARRFEVADIFHTAGGEIVEKNHTITAVEEAFRKVRTDETGAASDQIAQRASLKSLGIVMLMTGYNFGAGARSIGVRRLRPFLRTVAVRIWIIPIGVVIIRRARIHGVEDDAEDAALHAGE